MRFYRTSRDNSFNCPRIYKPPRRLSLCRSSSNGLTSDMCPEAELLICCARTRMNPERAEQIKALLQNDIDWAYLSRMALLHGMVLVAPSKAYACGGLRNR